MYYRDFIYLVYSTYKVISETGTTCIVAESVYLYLQTKRESIYISINTASFTGFVDGDLKFSAGQRDNLRESVVSAS